MIIFFWIVVGTIVASTSVALLCYKKSETTLSEIAEKLEKQESSPAQRASAGLSDSDGKSCMRNPTRC